VKTQHTILLFCIITLEACLPIRSSETSQVNHLINENLTEENIEKALEADFAVRINLTTNTASYYRGGEIKDQWKIASADVTGEFHKVNGIPESKVTPTGIYSVHDIEHCPSWYPRNPFNPKTGSPAKTELERSSLFAENRDLYGPCGKRNPLGGYALWFRGPYGIHGNASSWIFDLPIEDRRVSGGCIRNPNRKIEMVFNEIVESSLPEFKTRVADNKSQPYDEKETITFYGLMEKVKVNVIVGNWDYDPVLPGMETITKIIEVTIPPKFEKLCTVKYADPQTDLLLIFEKNPLRSVVGSYKKGEKVEVLSTIGSIFKTDRGYINGNYMSDCVVQLPTKELKEIEVPVNSLSQKPLQETNSED